MVPRTRVARTRLSQDEYDKYIEEPANEAGITPAEYLRNLIVVHRDLKSWVASLDNRLTHVEQEMAKVWQRQEVREHGQQGI